MKHAGKILFLCTGNSCRSQMAEGIARDWLSRSPFVPIEVLSAGIERHGVNPLAIQVMAESGRDISGQESTLLSAEMLDELDLVITLCGHADEFCPQLPEGVEKMHWPLVDPAKATGTEVEILQAFRASRDDIQNRVETLLIGLQKNMMMSKRSFTPSDVRVQQTDNLYKGFFALKGVRVQHRLFNGGWNDGVYRELLLREAAVAVLLYDPARESIALVEQFRVGALQEEPGPWQLELVAGIAEEGEDYETVALRECVEEAGCRPYELIPMMNYMVSPGGSNEKIFLYCGLADLSDVIGIHGLDSEGDDIRVSVLPLNVATFALEAGRINNAMTIMAVQWLLLNKQKTGKK